MSSIIGAVICTGIGIFTIFAILGFPIGEYTLGGKYKILPIKLRVFSISSLLILVISIGCILTTGGYLQGIIPNGFARGFCLAFGIYLCINTIMNCLSFSKKEKYVMTPISAIGAVCFLVTYWG